MMMATSRGVNQFLMMLYKGMLMRKRHFVITGFEMLLPILLAIIPIIVVLKLQIYDIDFYKNEDHSFEPLSPYDKFPHSDNGDIYVLYTPSNKVTEELMKATSKLWKSHHNMSNIVREKYTLESYATEELLEARAMDVRNSKSLVFAVGIVFNNLVGKESLPSSLDYVLRFGDSENRYTFTDRLSKFQPITVPTFFNEIYYEASQFLSWQAAIEQSFISMKASDSGSLNYRVMIQRFPFPSFSNYGAVTGLLLLVVLSVILYSYIVLLGSFTKRVVEEKVNHSRELLRMMGMTDCVYWTSTFVNKFMEMFVVSAIMTIFFKLPIQPESHGSGKIPSLYSVLNRSDGLLFFVFLLLHSANLIAMSAFITRFFSKGFWAVTLVMLAYLVPFYIMFALVILQGDVYLALSASSKLATCLYPNGALILMFKLLVTLEEKSECEHFIDKYDDLTFNLFTASARYASDAVRHLKCHDFYIISVIIFTFFYNFFIMV